MLNKFRETKVEEIHSSGHKLWDFSTLLAGILFTLSFSPFDYHYFALIAFTFLIASCLNLRPGRAFLRGYLFGLGMFGLGVSWVFVSIYDFGGANIYVSIILTFIFVAFWSLFPAIAALLAGIFPVKIEELRILIFPFVWILVEYVRGNWVLKGFPWLQIAYSQMESPLAGYIPIFGAYGNGLIVAITASILIILFKSQAQRAPFITILVFLWGTGFILKSVQWTYPIGGPIQVSLIQGNISQDQKWRTENKTATLALYKKLTEQHWDSDVIVWPETSIPAYLEEVKDYFLVPLSHEARQHNTDLIVSVPAHGRSENEKYNAVITLGREEGMYRKIHLLPFGEYLPWQPFSGFVLSSLKIRLGNFMPGEVNQPLLKAGGYSFITSICYEDAFSERAIKGIPDGAYLVNVTNDGWFGNSIEPHQHMQIARMRAMETGRFMLRATNTGLTGIIAPDGKIQDQAPLFTTAAIIGEIRPMGGMTPYAKLGDGPIIFFIVSVLCLIIIFDGYISASKLKDKKSARNELKLKQ